MIKSCHEFHINESAKVLIDNFYDYFWAIHHGIPYNKENNQNKSNQQQFINHIIDTNNNKNNVQIKEQHKQKQKKVTSPKRKRVTFNQTNSKSKNRNNAQQNAQQNDPMHQVEMRESGNNPNRYCNSSTILFGTLFSSLCGN